jgi:hypothetical protein
MADWSTLGDIGTAFTGAYDAASRKRTLADIGKAIQSGDYDAGAKAAFGSGDVTTGLALSKLAQDRKGQATFASQFPSIAGGGAAATGGGSAPADASPIPGGALDKGKFVYDGLVKRGVPSIVALGLAGNAYGESGLNPNAVGDGGTSYGLIQARGPRFAQLQQVAAQNGTDWRDPETQLDHVAGELSGPYAKAAQIAAQAKTPEEAALAIAQHYERPAAWALQQSGPKRAAFARALAPYVGFSGQNTMAGLGLSGTPADAAAQQGAAPAAASADPPVVVPGFEEDGPYTRASLQAKLANPKADEEYPTLDALTKAQGGARPSAPSAPSAARPVSPPQVQASAAQGGLRLSPNAAKLIALMSLPGITEGQKESAKIALQQEIEASKQPEEFKKFLLTQQNPAFKAFLDRNQKSDEKGPRVIKQVGADGTERSYQYDEKSKSFVPLKITGADAQPQGSGEIAQLPTGEEALKGMPPQVQALVKKIANYEVDPRALSVRGGHREQLLGLVSRYDPEFDMATYPARAAALKEFNAGGPNSPAGTITSGNTAVQHLGSLSNISQKLQTPFGLGPLNNVADQAEVWLKRQSGNPDLAEYNNIVGKYVEEATKFYRGTGGSEADIKRDLEALSAAQTPESRARAIAAQAELMQSKVNALQSRFKTALGGNAWKRATESAGPDFPIIQQKTAEALEAIRRRNAAMGAPEAAAPAVPAKVNGYTIRRID